MRQDRGDAETGFGVVCADPTLGLMVDATINLLVAHQDSRYEEWDFTGSVRFEPGLAGRGLSLTMTPSFGMAAQGADRLWGMQEVGGLIPYGTVPFDMGGQFAADVGYGMDGPGGHGTGTPYAGLSAVGHGLPCAALRVAVDRGSAVQRGGRGGEAGTASAGCSTVSGTVPPTLAAGAPRRTRCRYRGGLSF